MPKKKRKWLSTSLKVAGILTAFAGIVYLLTRNTDDENNLNYIPYWNGDKKGGSDLRLKYDSSWIESASLEELEEARQEVQDDYRNPELDEDYRSDLWDLLFEFDAAISEKRWNE